MTISTDAAMRLCETVRMLRHLAIHLPDPMCLSFLAPDNGLLPEQASPSVRATERAINAAFARIGVRTVQYLHGGEA
ncbi:alpha/beta hydrolase, partial [Pseudomonas sp. MWU12-2115]